MTFLENSHNDGDEVGRSGEGSGALLQAGEDLLASAKQFNCENQFEIKTYSEMQIYM